MCRLRFLEKRKCKKGKYIKPAIEFAFFFSLEHKKCTNYIIRVLPIDLGIKFS